MRLTTGGSPAVRRGDWVYVHPDEAGAPREVRGLAGVVAEATSGRATVDFHGPESVCTMEVDARILRRDRRRHDRPPASWGDPELAATG